MALRLAVHARQRLRERHLPLEAVLIVIADPERVEVLDAGTWNERFRHSRRLGRIRVTVIWTWEFDDRFVLTVMCDPVRNSRRGE